MKLRGWLFCAIVMGLSAGIAIFVTAQTGVQQTASSLNSAAVCSSLDAASGSATLTPPSSQSVYVTSIDINVGGSGTVTAAAPVKATSAGLSGSPTFGLFRSDAMTIGQVGAPFVMSYPFGLKGQTNTAVSVTGGAVTNLVWHITVCGYYAN